MPINTVDTIVKDLTENVAVSNDVLDVPRQIVSDVEETLLATGTFREVPKVLEETPYIPLEWEVEGHNIRLKAYVNLEMKLYVEGGDKISYHSLLLPEKLMRENVQKELDNLALDQSAFVTEDTFEKLIVPEVWGYEEGEDQFSFYPPKDSTNTLSYIQSLLFAIDTGAVPVLIKTYEEKIIVHYLSDPLPQLREMYHNFDGEFSALYRSWEPKDIFAEEGFHQFVWCLPAEQRISLVPFEEGETLRVSYQRLTLNNYWTWEFATFKRVRDEIFLLDSSFEIPVDIATYVAECLFVSGDLPTRESPWKVARKGNHHYISYLREVNGHWVERRSPKVHISGGNYVYLPNRPIYVLDFVDLLKGCDITPSVINSISGKIQPEIKLGDYTFPE